MFRLENAAFDIAMVVVALWIVKRFWECFFDVKKPKIAFYLSCVIYCALQMIFQVYRGHMNLFLSLTNLAMIFAICLTGYDCRGKAKYFLLICLWTIWSLMELLASFIIGGMHLSGPSFGVLGEVISKIFMMGVVYWISIINFKKKEGEIPNKLYIWLFFIPLGSVYIAIHEFYIESKPIFSMLTISILLVFNVIIFEMYIKMNEFFIQEKENAMSAQQMDMIAVNTAEQKRMLEQFHEEKHNLVNELIVLKELVSTKREREAVANIDEIINGQAYVKRIANTGNSTVDAIINFKYALASEYGIAFQLKAFIPQEMPVSQNDIGVVLGNALDNAIEATKACNNSEKKIEISMGIKKEAWVIVIRNPYENEIKRNRAGEIVTNKSDRTRHGYGLKSIQKITEKYQGDTVVDVDVHTFTLTAVLNFEEI